MSVALCMIVRDEAATLRRAVESCPLDGFLDGLVIAVDARSEDDTLEVALALGREFKGEASIYPFDKWSGFSDARNLAASHASTDWIMVLDGHEHVDDPSSLARVFRQVEDNDAVSAAAVRIACKAEASGCQQPAMAWQARFYRKGLLYQLPVHNQLQIPDGGTLAYLQESWIVHDRPAELSAKRARTRNKDVPQWAQTSLESNPEGHEALYYLQYHAMESGDEDGAIGLCQKFLASTAGTTDNVNIQLSRCVCIQNWACIELARGNYAEVQRLCGQQIGEYPDSAMAYVTLAEVAFLRAQESEAGRGDHLHKARSWATTALRCEMPMCTIFLPVSSWTYLPHLVLARVEGTLTNYGAALDHVSTTRQWWSIIPETERDVLTGLERKLRALEAVRVLFPDREPSSEAELKRKFDEALAIVFGGDNGDQQMAELP